MTYTCDALKARVRFNAIPSSFVVSHPELLGFDPLSWQTVKLALAAHLSDRENMARDSVEGKSRSERCSRNFERNPRLIREKRGRPIIREEDLERIRDKDRRICGMLLELKHIVLCSARKEAESHVDYDL